MADGQTELTILLPRRGFAAGWQRVLHDATADQIAAAVGQLAHVNATVVPYQLDRRLALAATRLAPQAPTPTGRPASRVRSGRRTGRTTGTPRHGPPSTGSLRRTRPGVTPIGEVQWRQPGPGGRAGSSRCGSSPGRGPPISSACSPTTSGRLLLVFQGRRRIPGIQPGARLVVEGMVGDWAHRQAILNPDYELIAGPEASMEPT